MKKLNHFRRLSFSLAAAALAVSLLPAAAHAQAQGLKPSWVYGQAAFGENGTRSATVGIGWPWAWRGSLLGSEVGGQTELYGSVWSSHDFGGGRQTFAQVGLVPVFRFRLDEGRSPWFLEAGIGFTYMDKVFLTPDKTFSTKFQFHDTLGVGYSFGADRSSELGLRLTHYSNAGIDKPNPGINFLQLRYGVRF